MKTAKSKYIHIVFANYIPALCACLLYFRGSNIWLLYMLLQIILIFLNHKNTTGKLSLLFLHTNLLISTITANWVGTHLYYTRISSDPETLMVGDLGMLVGAIFVILLSITSLLIRIISIRISEKNEIAPFFWIKYEEEASVCLDTGEYLQEVFDTRADEGFEGNGYDWERLTKVFLAEKSPHLIEKIEFGSKDGTFCAYSKDITALQEFIDGFRNACEDRTLILDLFSRAELD